MQVNLSRIFLLSNLTINQYIFHQCFRLTDKKKQEEKLKRTTNQIMQVAMKMIDPGSQSKAVLCFTKAGATQFQCSTAIRLNT